MTDFYTKKQKKFRCDKCNIFIEYNKASIEKHNSSRIHLSNVSSDGRYKSIKKKYDNYVNGLNNNKEDDNLLGKKKIRSNEMYNIESSNYMQEIKMTMMKEDVINMKKQKINEKKRIWGVFWDPTYCLPYYYNFQTGESVWEKPIDYDGTTEEIDQLLLANEKLGNTLEDYTTNKNPNEGIIGQWEVVSNDKSVFGKRKNSDDEVIENKEKTITTTPRDKKETNTKKIIEEL